MGLFGRAMGVFSRWACLAVVACQVAPATDIPTCLPNSQWLAMGIHKPTLNVFFQNVKLTEWLVVFGDVPNQLS